MDLLIIDLNIIMSITTKVIKKNIGNLGRELKIIQTDRMYMKKKQPEILELKKKNN